LCALSRSLACGELEAATGDRSRHAANEPETIKKRNDALKAKAVFDHAGCPVCVAAEQNVAEALDPARFDVEVVHLGEQKARIAEAEQVGVKSVPALALDGTAYHINLGADLSALK